MRREFSLSADRQPSSSNTMPDKNKASLHRAMTRAAMMIAWLLGGLSALGQVATMITPAPGSALTASTTFTWTDAGTVYRLAVGTTGVNSHNIHSTGDLTATSHTLTGLPVNQRVYVRLWSRNGAGPSYYYRDYVYNIDADQDGIDDLIDPNPGAANPKIILPGPSDTLTLLGSGRVASLQVAPGTFTGLARSMTRGQMQMLCQSVYARLDDAFDFIFFSNNLSELPAGYAYSGIYFPAKNDTQGLGANLYDGTADYGSAGKLQGAMHLSVDSALMSGPSLHELLHRWGVYLKNPALGITTTGNHWGYSSAGGQLGGWQPGSLEHLGGNRYRARNPRTGEFGSFGYVANGGNSLPYSELELYLMGLVDASQVSPIQIASNFAWENQASGIFTASSITTLTIADIIAANGTRSPSPAASQKNFRVLHVVLTPTPLDNGRWMHFDTMTERFARPGDDGIGQYNFWEATGGRATLTISGLLDTTRSSQASIRVLNVAREGSGALQAVSVTFESTPGATYRSEKSLDLKTWQTVTPMIAATAGATSTSTRIHIGNERSAFVRIVRLP